MIKPYHGIYMKLLLTSAGFTNNKLKNCLRKLVKGKIRIAFVPTAANVTEGEKDWLISNLVECQKVGSVDIVDISALKKQELLPKLKAANVLVFGGGNEFHLIYWMKKSGLAKVLKKLLKTRVYVGISAGSMVTNPKLSAFLSKPLYFEKAPRKDIKGLGLVNLFVLPHLNSTYFNEVRNNKIEYFAEKLGRPLYMIDDQSAVLVDNGKVSVIGKASRSK